VKIDLVEHCRRGKRVDHGPKCKEEGEGSNRTCISTFREEDWRVRHSHREKGNSSLRKGEKEGEGKGTHFNFPSGIVSQ